MRNPVWLIRIVLHTVDVNVILFGLLCVGVFVWGGVWGVGCDKLCVVSTF